MRQLPSVSAGWMTVSALVGSVSVASYYLYYNWKAKQPRTRLEDLQGNFYASGSDVCRLYHDRIPHKVVLITGTSSGLGAHTATLLGKHGAFVIMGLRCPDDARIISEEIEKAGGTAVALPLDLASFASIQEFAKLVCDTLQQHNKLQLLQVIIHNAGISFVNGSTENGYQSVWQVNALGPALLTELLVPNMDPNDSRIIYVSSEMHRFCFGSSIREKCPPMANAGAASTDYALSKACQILQALEMTCRRCAFSSSSSSSSSSAVKMIRGFAIEPGLVRTKIGRHVPSQWLLELEYLLLSPFLLKTTDQGCSSILYCALAPLEQFDSDNQRYYYYANCQPKQPKHNCTILLHAQQLQQLYQECWKDFAPTIK
jgi:NAD(P)-dependent dehydrogenase (short-subunit alcohol dehydrogenase family)